MTTRSAVVAAAGKLMERYGPARLSVREAARLAGVSHNAPYRHFPDRDSLLGALAEEGFRELEHAVAGRSGRELGGAYVRFALEHPQRFRLMFAAPRAAAMRERFAEAFGALGESRDVAAAASWSLVHGLAELAIAGHIEKSDDFVRRVLGAMRFAQRSA